MGCIAAVLKMGFLLGENSWAVYKHVFMHESHPQGFEFNWNARLAWTLSIQSFPGDYFVYQSMRTVL